MLDFLWLIFIAPIEFCMKAVFEGGYALTHSYGLALIGVSLVVNTAVLPIYNKAEGWQEEERALKKRMEPKEKMIRRCFRGQERFAMLSTLYKQCGFSPLMTLRASIGLLLQIPFFLAAYLLLSNMAVLDGVSFGPIRNLGAPDGLLSIGGVHINVLPILMTAVNLFSAFFYTHGLSRRDKIQLYGMAGIFLVLLYNSPAGLTFYWTLNNIYSLCKNIVQKDWMKRPGWTEAMHWLEARYESAGAAAEALAPRLAAWRVQLSGPRILMGAAALFLLGAAWGRLRLSLTVAVPLLAALLLLIGIGILAYKKVAWLRRFSLLQLLVALAGAAGFVFIVAKYGVWQGSFIKVVVRLLLLGLALAGVLFCEKFAPRIFADARAQKKELGALFLPAVTLLAFLVFVYLPFMVFSSDPLVFDMGLEDFASNRFGVFLAILICIAVAGVLLRPVRWLFGALFSMCALAALAFCFIVAPDVGVMDAFILQKPEALDQWYNRDVDALIFMGVFFLFLALIWFRKLKIFSNLIYSALALLFVMVGVHFSTAQATIAGIEKSKGEISDDTKVPEHVEKFFTFSRHGKNIVVVMLDMFTGGNMNQLLERHPELKTELDGFIWYEDVVTAGNATIFGKAPILGGEAAHPFNLNKDASKSLEEKFAATFGKFFSELQERNFRLSVFDNDFFHPELVYPYLKTTENTNFVNAPWLLWEGALSKWKKMHNFNMNTSQSFSGFFNILGFYNISPLTYKNKLYDNGRWNKTISKASYDIRFTTAQLAGLELPLYASKISDTDENCFIYIMNLLPHFPWILDENGMPEKKEAWKYDPKELAQGFSDDHIRAEYFTLKKLIAWFDWMKKNNVYNNTEIILVSDHDHHGDSLEIRKIWASAPEPPLFLHGLLLVKEFGAHGELRIDRKSLMANWDVVTIIRNSLAAGAEEKQFPWQDQARQRLHVFGNWRRAAHKKNTFNFLHVYNIQGPIYNKESWIKLQ
ncbi:MAG: hypothetical protein HDQ89_08340 [Desulfovibrio sp.]|nr:hypothetical protein [Desulfovibrio sp.]